jgi:hypothetical protein
MAVHVDQMTSAVSVEPESPAQGYSEGAWWEEVAQLRDLQARLLRDRLRTAAEGFDD